MSNRTSNWVCDDCLALVPNPCIKTIPDFFRGEACAACKVFPKSDRHLVDDHTFRQITSRLAPKVYRPEMEPPTARIAALPVHDGWPIPFFVDYLPDGTPEFRAMDPRKFVRCVKERLCWVCGQPFESSEVTFVAGPMCAINRTIAEPPSHEECAQWSARNCPFLKNPNYARREAGVGKGAEKLVEPAGMLIRRNPKVILLWTTTGFRLFSDSNGGVLINMGPPRKTEWLSDGKPATRAQVEESVKTGLPLLFENCDGDLKAVEEINRRALAIESLFPMEIVTA